MTRTFFIGLAAISLAACAQEPLDASAQTQFQGSATRLIAAEAQRQGVPQTLALKVAKVESGHRCNAVGPQTRSGRAQGPLQIMPRSARGLGHRGGPLANCGAGLHYGMKHLAMCYRAARGNQAVAARCHNGGIGAISRPSRSTHAYVRTVMNTR